MNKNNLYLLLAIVGIAFWLVYRTNRKINENIDEFEKAKKNENGPILEENVKNEEPVDPSGGTTVNLEPFTIFRTVTVAKR